MQMLNIQQSYKEARIDSQVNNWVAVREGKLPGWEAHQERLAQQAVELGYGDTSMRDDIIVRVRQWPDGQMEVVGYPVRVHRKSEWEGQFGVAVSKAKAKRGESSDEEKSMASAMQRARRRVRENAKTAQLDHLLTLTWRGVMDDRDNANYCWDKFIKRVKRDRRLVADGERFHFVAVLEFHKSGGIHIHAGVHGFRSAEALREHWYAVVGKAEGNVDIQGPNSKGRKRISGVHKVAAYLSKYITKGTGHKLNERRYWASKGIDIPERFTIGQYRSETDEQSFSDAASDAMRWLVQNGANFQGMMAYVSHGRKAFWFAMAATGHEEPVELDDDDGVDELLAA